MWMYFWVVECSCFELYRVKKNDLLSMPAPRPLMYIRTSHPLFLIMRNGWNASVSWRMRDTWETCIPLISSNRTSVGCAGQTSLIHGGPTSQLKGLKDLLLRYRCQIPQRSSGIHTSTSQNCFGGKKGTYMIFGRRSKCYGWSVYIHIVIGCWYIIRQAVVPTERILNPCFFQFPLPVCSSRFNSHPVSFKCCHWCKAKSALPVWWVKGHKYPDTIPTGHGGWWC